MMHLAADENFNNDILRALRRRYPDLDLIRIQDTDVSEAEDDVVLAWAAREDRILLTYDARTVPQYAYARVSAGLPMPGVFEVRYSMPVGEAVEELALIIEDSSADDWKNQVTYMPLQ
jgi:hypothetical protein